MVRGAGKTMAPLAIPAAVMVPAATAGAAVTGGAGKLLGTGLSRAMGASPETSEAIGDVTSLPGAYLGSRIGSRLADIPSGNVLDAAQHLPWPIGQTVRAGRALFAAPTAEPSAPFEPVRPNPAVASKMRFGGPVQQGGGPAYPGVGMSGAPEVAPAPVEAFQPNKVNPNIARNLRFGGSVDAEGGPAYGRVGMSGAPSVPPPPAPPTVTPFQPNKVNPNISRQLRFTPSAEPGANADAGPASTLGTRAEMMRQLRLRQAQQNVAPPPVSGER